MFLHILGIWESAAHARRWLLNEISMDEEEGLGRNWRSLLVEPVREEIFCLIRDGEVFIWDGHHRAAALICTGRPIVAIVGSPMAEQQHTPRPAGMRISGV